MSVRDELRANPRLRLGLAVIAGTLGFYGLLAWQDHQQELAAQGQRLSAQVQRLSSRQAMDQWPQRAEDAQQVLQAVQRRLWRQSSVGLAQAEFQDWLREQLRRTNALNAVVKIAEADEPAARAGAGAGAGADTTARAPRSDLTRVSAQVEFANTDPQILLALLAGLAGPERTVVVQVLSVKPQRVEMRLAAWFLLPAPPGNPP